MEAVVKVAEVVEATEAIELNIKRLLIKVNELYFKSMLQFRFFRERSEPRLS